MKPAEEQEETRSETMNWQWNMRNWDFAKVHGLAVEEAEELPHLEEDKKIPNLAQRVLYRFGQNPDNGLVIPFSLDLCNVPGKSWASRILMNVLIVLGYHRENEDFMTLELTKDELMYILGFRGVKDEDEKFDKMVMGTVARELSEDVKVFSDESLAKYGFVVRL